jgi:adenylyltransferase/sulfurtransferase
MVRLTQSDLARYDRQMLIDGWGKAGQQRLKASTVFIAGAGGLGSPVAIYLAVAGVGHIRICDSDRVERSNLNRQILHPDARTGDPKAGSAAGSLMALNPDIQVDAISAHLDTDSVDDLVGKPDVLVDCLDNFGTRYLLNDYCLKHGIPFVHGAVRGMMGQTTFLTPPDGPCLRCIFPEAPPKEVFPVVGATPGIIGGIQALETLKFLTGVGTTLKRRLLIFEGEEMVFTEIKVERSERCPACGSAS